MTDAIVEAVARAIGDEHEEATEWVIGVELAERLARAAIAAYEREAGSIREAALREAAEACDWGDIYGDNAVKCILALLPAPPEGQ